MNSLPRILPRWLAALAAFATALPIRAQSADTTPPAVSAFVFDAATSTSGTYTITFSESVTGVTLDDFHPVTTGNTAASITGVSGSGASYTVAFAYTGNTGELQLRIRPTGTGIADTAGNAFAGSGTTSANIIPNTNRTGDIAAPVAASFTAGTAVAGAAPFTVTFDEPVDGVAAGMFAVSGLSGASIGSVVSSGTAGTSYLVTVNYPGASGTVSLALNAATYAGIRDFNGNAYAGGGTTSATATIGVAGDTTAPTVASFEVMIDSGPTLLIKFSEAVTGVDPVDFTTTIISGNGTAAVTQVTATSTPGTYSLQLSYSGTGTARVALKAAGTGIADSSGNIFAGGGTIQTQTYSFTSGSASPDTTAPAAPTIASFSPDAGVGGDGITSYGPLTFSGTAEPSSVVSLYFGDPASFPTAGTAIANVSGTWTITIGALSSAGTRILRATARDAAGNVSALSAGFTFTVVDITAPPSHLGVQGVGLTISHGDSTPNPGDGTDFGTILASASNTRGYRLYGTSNAGLAITSVTFDGPNAGDFSVAEQPAAFLPKSASDISDTTLLVVRFAPSAPGLRSARVRIASSDPDRPIFTFAIQGTAVASNPRLISLQRPAPGTYRPGDILAFGLTFDNPVEFTGAPRLPLQIGSNTRYATVRSINGAPAALAFYYTLTTEDADANGIALGAEVDLNGGTIRAGGTAVAELYFPHAGIPSATHDLSGIRVDVAPLATAQPAIWPLAVTGAVGHAQPFGFDIRADGRPTQFAVTGLPSSMGFSAATGRIGGNVGTPTSFVAQVTASNSAGSTALPMKFTLAAPDVSPVPLPDGNDISSVAVAVDGTYRAGDALTFVVDLTFPAVVIGTPRLELRIGSRTRYAAHVGTSGSAVVFRYLVAADDADADGIELVRGIQFPTGGWLRAAPTSSVPGMELKTSWLAQPDTSRILIGGTPPVTPPVVPPVTPPVVVPPVVIPPTPVAQNQTITFATPVSSIFVNRPMALGGVATSTLPISYTIVSGNATVDGTVITIRDTQPVVVRATQAGNASWNPAAPVETTFVAIKSAQAITFPSLETRLTTDSAISLAATSSSGLPITYTLVSGPATLSGTTLRLTGEPGTVVIRAAQAGDGATSSAVEVTRSFAVNPAVRVSNLSSRLRVTSGDGSRTVIAGFVIDGTAMSSIMVRAIGPGLAQFGIADALAAPRLQLFNSAGAVVAENSGWNNSAEVANTSTRVGAFALAVGSTDSAVVAQLPPGAYTAQVTAASAGTVLIEVYDAATGTQLSTQQLVNISTRGFVDTGDGALIAGFVVDGSASKRVLVRGIGPGLTQFGVPSALADPVVKIYANGTATPIAENDNWESTTAISAAITAAGAFPLAGGSKDAAIVLVLPPGQYSAVITGVAGATGAGLVEVYELPNP